MRVSLGPFFKLLDHHGGRVRDFFLGLHQHLFADDLRHHETHRLIRDLVFGKIARAFRQEPQHLFQQHFQAFALPGRERNHLAEIVQLAVLLDDGQQFFFCSAQQIDLVQQQKDRRSRLLRHFEHETGLRG